MQPSILDFAFSSIDENSFSRSHLVFSRFCFSLEIIGLHINYAVIYLFIWFGYKQLAIGGHCDSLALFNVTTP